MQDKSVQTVIEILGRVLEAPTSSLTPETKVLEIDGFDSLAMEQFVGELQNRAGEVDPMAFAQVETISDLARILESASRNAG